MNEENSLEVQLKILADHVKNIEKQLDAITTARNKSNESFQLAIKEMDQNIDKLTNQLIKITTQNTDRITELEKKYKELTQHSQEETRRLRNIILVLIPLLVSTSTTLIIEAISLFHL